MAHELFGSRFYSFREPAWHKLGLVLDEPLSAQEALRRIGSYQVHLYPLTSVEKIPGLVVPHKAIIRQPTADDPHPRLFGIVTEDYELVTPEVFCQLWDLATSAPAETVGSLRRGSSFFISTKIPDINIKGELLENYLLAYSPMTGLDAIELRVTPVRVVCQNTLVLSASQATQTMKIKHTGDVQEAISYWLREAYQTALHQADALAQVFEMLATTSISSEGLGEALRRTYPYPRQQSGFVRAPKPDGDEVAKTLVTQAVMDNRREAVTVLFNGAGTGMSQPPAKGSAWGLYNCVVEFEDYRRGKTGSSAAEALIGQRAQAKIRAYEACLALAIDAF